MLQTVACYLVLLEYVRSQTGDEDAYRGQYPLKDAQPERLQQQSNLTPQPNTYFDVYAPLTKFTILTGGPRGRTR